MNACLGEPIGLVHAFGQRYYQNKTMLRYNFGSVYKQGKFVEFYPPPADYFSKKVNHKHFLKRSVPGNHTGAKLESGQYVVFLLFILSTREA